MQSAQHIKRVLVPSIDELSATWTSPWNKQGLETRKHLGGFGFPFGLEVGEIQNGHLLRLLGLFLFFVLFLLLVIIITALSACTGAPHM